ncbi:hypothetical protein DL546_009325 [Coniochaeta pulveracea]|uniref:F-box domain-containing protein n=1 Tax=Coniochaeta pulveracea TaxID=177199 RepID=A0A420YMC8_9PEZI|nr:hypothetical protein DL546_009325 [Coniochaeta pulveracea]
MVAHTCYRHTDCLRTKDMDSLPVELLRVVFEACDPPSVRSLRAVARILADVGYDYLLPPHITIVWGDDGIKRLHSIAAHQRLRTCIESVAVKVGSWPMKYPGYIQGVGGFEFRSSLLQLGNELEHALQMLPNLKSVNLDLKEATPPGPNPHLWDTKDMATETAINAIVSAASRGTLSSLAVHRLPLQILSVEPGRPQSSVRAINGLGRVLRFASNLTHLSLEFVNSAILYQRFPLDFQELFSDFTFEKLTDLKLGGFACTESELGSFLLRHAATLERLRLGGRAAWRKKDPVWGGITLYSGSWRSLFNSLAGKLPQLKRFHVEGFIENGDRLHLGLCMFEPLTDDAWEPCSTPRTRSLQTPGRQQYLMNSSDLERFLLHGGPNPVLMM